MGIFDKKPNEDKKDKKTESKPAVKTSNAKTEPAAKSSMQDLYNGETAVAGTKEAKAAKKNANAYRVLVKPLITEKAANIGMQNKYVFAVNKKANKIEVGKAIQEVYGIKPVNVNVINVMGKKVRHGRIKGVRSDFKKAIVTLPAGKTINIYEGV